MPKRSPPTREKKVRSPAKKKERLSHVQYRLRQRRKRLLTWGIAGLVVALLLLAAGFTLLRHGTASSLEGVVTYSDQPRGHKEGSLTYSQTPPVGGIHNAAWQNCGIYDEPVPNELAVHSLEHGAVWISYRPDLSASTVEQLRTLLDGRPYTLLSPYPQLPAPIVATAWGAQLKVDKADDPRLAQFLATYEQGPQTPEPGAACTGGKGIPVASGASSASFAHALAATLWRHTA